MEKLKTIIVTVLATLGVLFIIIMIIPDDEEEDSGAVNTVTNEEVSEQETEGTDIEAQNIENWIVGDQKDDQKEDAETENDDQNPNEQVVEEQLIDEQEKEESESEEPENIDIVSQPEPENADEPEAEADTTDTANNASIIIPQSELSKEKLSFRTTSLDNTELTQDVFAEYDLTIVHVWGTYCVPCLKELDDYAALYNNLPDNVNLIGLICDVYDGIDSNVDDAEALLQDAGAGFVNMRSSDDLYGILSEIPVIPSSFFVDREGHIVGSIMIGANFDQTKSRLEELAN